MQLRLIFYLRPRLAPRREGFYPGKERDRRSLERATTLGPTGVAGELPRGEKEESEEAFGERRREEGARGGGSLGKTERHGDRGGEWSNSTVISFFG